MFTISHTSKFQLHYRSATWGGRGSGTFRRLLDRDWAKCKIEFSNLSDLTLYAVQTESKRGVETAFRGEVLDDA